MLAAVPSAENLMSPYSNVVKNTGNTNMAYQAFNRLMHQRLPSTMSAKTNGGNKVIIIAGTKVATVTK